MSMSEPEYQPSTSSSANAVHRMRAYAKYDYETVWGIVDENLICHVGFRLPEGEDQSEEWPVVLPMALGRIDETIFLHGHLSSRLMKALSQPGTRVCLTFTSIQSLVLARSAFHNSFTYRSCVIFGTATLIPDSRADDKLDALKAITNHPFRNVNMPPANRDRWDDSRKASEMELKSTRVVEVALEMASAKVTAGGPEDDKKDLADSEVTKKYWAGEVMRKTGWDGIKNSGVNVTAAVPQYVLNLIAESK